MPSVDSDSKPEMMSDSELISYMNRTLDRSYSLLSKPVEPESELLFFITRIVYVLSYGLLTYLYGSPLLSTFISLSMQLKSLVISMDLDTQPKPESELISLIKQIISYRNSVPDGWEPESQVVSLVTQMISLTKSNQEQEIMLLVAQIFYHLDSVNSDSELLTLITQIISLAHRKYNELDQKITPSIIEVLSCRHSTYWDAKFLSYVRKIISHNKSQLTPESSLKSLITSLILSKSFWMSEDPKILAQYAFQSDEIISLVSSMHLDSQPKPESEFISMIKQVISLVNSTHLDSQQKTELKVMSLIKQIISHNIYTAGFTSWSLLVLKLKPLVFFEDFSIVNTLNKQEQKLMSLIYQIFSLIISKDLNLKKRNSLCPQAQIRFEKGKFHVIERKISWSSNNKWKCLPFNWEYLSFPGDEEFALPQEPAYREQKQVYTHFHCPTCNGENHKEYNQVRVETKQPLHPKHYLQLARVDTDNKTMVCNCCDTPFNWEYLSFPGDEDFALPQEPANREQEQVYTHFHCPTCNGENHKEYNQVRVETKHPLHPKHYLQLVMVDTDNRTRVCYCCDRDLRKMFYYCLGCDYAMNIDCVKKPAILSIEHSKWHEHTLALFPRQTSLNCNVCALTHSSCPIYMCPPCDFVVHQKCINLPRAVKISRHRHRIHFTPSFDQGDLSCGICRKKINNDYGGYKCLKKECFYVAHTRCGTQSNVWDGIDLDGVPEEVEEEEVPPFVTISDGIIEHFSHPIHYLRLDQNIARDYDENKLCQVCITPIYFGNIYSCLKCDFILHEECAKLSRKIQHPIHPHLLTLTNTTIKNYFMEDSCSACPWLCAPGFLYKCATKMCRFKVHVQCGTISEPLTHPSHNHPLFLTSKPEENGRICSVCKNSRQCSTQETFNCVEEECDFALCYGCATLPQHVKYKHDEHVLTLSYGEKKSTMTYWCEICEGRIESNQRFYRCDEYCCVTLHIDCMLGVDLYMNPGSPWLSGPYVHSLPNNHMSRPICRRCGKRCPHKVYIETYEGIYCSSICLRNQKVTK